MSAPSIERIPDIVVPEPPLEHALEEIWKGESGLRGWISTVDHKRLGLMYIVTAFGFLLMGGIEALTMRVQLARPQETILSPAQYDQLFSTHGITMIFLYALPIVTGFSVYIWPLFLGTRDLAFPRLNALSYWTYLAAGMFIYIGFFLGSGPNDGWFNYVPYANRQYNPGMNMDFYALGFIIFGISTTLSSANFVGTWFRLKCPGMSINRVPIMTWGTLTSAFSTILFMPSATLAFLMLWLDRTFDFQFFHTGAGGQPLLWQHLFWIFGHPWVYAIVLPAQGMVSEILPVYCRRPLVGYTAVVIATVATMLLGTGVWVHHMFATGLPRMSLALFGSVSFIIAIPSAVQVFAWIATIWTGRPVIKTAFLFAASVIVLLTIGGVSGFMTAAVPVDWQLTDTYWVVAHIHYVLIGINLFGVMAGMYYWFPKMTGRMLSETLGQWNFWVMFVGFNAAFLPMHLTGLWGMPRRIYTYLPGLDWGTLNLATTIGAFILAIGILLFIINVFYSYMYGEIAGNNPWDAASLEWAVSSPPPVYDHAVIPQITDRYPLWEDRLQETMISSSLHEGPALTVGKEVLVTSSLEAVPELIQKLPEDSYSPFVMTLGIAMGFVGLLVHWWWLAGLGAFVTVCSGVVWLWPERELAEVAEPRHG